MNGIIKIYRKAGKRKHAVRVHNVFDVPDFLRESVEITRHGLTLTNSRGITYAPFGAVIGYEKTDTGSWDCWWIEDAETKLLEVGSTFYTKGVVLEAEKMTAETPRLMNGASIWHNVDGSWSLDTSYGIQTGRPGEAYWVRTKIDRNGIPKGYILRKNEESYKSFFVCNDSGNTIGRLCELDPATF